MPNYKLEMKKTLRSKTLVVLILLCFLIPGVVLYQNQANSDRYATNLYSKMNTASLDMYMAKREYQKILDEVGLSKEEAEPHLAFFTVMEGEMEELLNLPRDYQSRHEIPRQMVAFYNAYQAYAEDRTVNYRGRQFFHMHKLGDDASVVAREKSYFQELVDRGLPYEDPVYSMSGLNFVKTVFDAALGMPLALLLILLLAGIFAGEKEDDTEIIRLTQPVKRWNIFFAKLLTALTCILVFLALLLAVSYLLAGLLGSGFGSFTYPLEVDRGFIDTCGPLWQSVGLAALYYCLYLLVIISALALFAIFAKGTSLTAALGLLLVYAGDLFGAKATIFNPFSYHNFQYYISWGNGRPLLMGGIALAVAALISLLTYRLNHATWVQNFTLSGKRKEGGRALIRYQEKRALPFPVFRFEALKIVKKTTVVIPFFLLVALALLQGFKQYDYYEQGRELEVFALQVCVDRFLNWTPPEGVGEEYLDRSESIRQYEIEVNFLEALESGDAGRIIQAQKDYYLGSASMQNKPHVPETITVYTATLDEMIERGVEPIYADTVMFPGSIQSPFTNKEDARYIKEFNRRISQPSVTFILNSLFKSGLAVLALAVFAVSLALGFSDETQDTRTIYLLNTQPVHRRRLFFGKLTAQGTVFLAMVLILVLVLSGGLLLGGSPLEKNFPAVKYLNSVGGDYIGERLWRSNLRVHEGRPLPASTSDVFVGFTFRDMMDENLEMIALLALSGLGLVTLALVISQGRSSKIGVSLGAVLFFGLGYVLSRYALGGGFYLPFIWLDSPLVATGEASMIFDQNIITSQTGILVLGLWLAAFVFLGYRVYCKTGRYL